MKKTTLALALTLSLIAAPAFGATEKPNSTEQPEISLEDQLERLSAPANQAPSAVNSEQLYAVQSRYSPLEERHEISIGGGHNFTPDSFTVSQQIDLSYRYYLSNRWFLGATGSYVFNDFSQAGQDALNKEGLIPDAAYAKTRIDALVGYNLFYGKFRLSMDEVFYFDQYVALGPGLVSFDTGNEIAVVGDIGFVAWIGKNFSLRFGLKDYFVNHVRVKESGMAHNFLGHLEFGYVL